MQPIACAIHGGAGALARDKYSAEEIEESKHVLLSLALEAKAQLQTGARALDVACHIVKQLEEHVMFNAGHGSVLNADGIVEMDASVMDSATGIGAGVTGLTTVRHPVECALALAKLKGHTLLAGAGAERFARQQGLECMPPAWFMTDKRRGDFEEFLRSKKIKLDHDSGTGNTVGAAVLDSYGELAAATSTGGMTGKAPGRVSDSSVIGAGTWAHRQTLATSGTGTGDHFIRMALCHHIHMRMLTQQMDFIAAHSEALALLKEAGGMGGFASVSAHGEVHLPFISGGMFRAGFGRNCAPFSAIWD